MSINKLLQISVPNCDLNHSQFQTSIWLQLAADKKSNKSETGQKENPSSLKVSTHSYDLSLSQSEYI